MRWILAVVCMLGSFAATANAQLLQGSITGNVFDPSNAAVVGAKVVATEQQTNFTRETTTNDQGGYNLLTMPPGTYRITVTSPAFEVRCADANIATYTVALDKSQYQTGDVATLTITAKDLRGLAPASATTLGAGASIALGGMTAVTAPSTADTSYNDDGVWTYKYTVGTSTGSFVASVQLPSALVDDTAKTIQYKIVSSSTSVTNEEVLAAIVKLIASINKQIAALQKALTKKK